MPSEKWCNSGKHYVNTQDFPKAKGNPDGLDYYCKSCRKLRRKARQQKESDYQKEYRKNNRDSRREYSRQFNENNKDYFSSWRAANLDKTRAYSRGYYSKKRSATPKWLTEEQFKQIEEFYSHARDCELVSGEKYHVDHILPIKGENVCGLHVPWNLQVLPADLNISKSNKVANG